MQVDTPLLIFAGTNLVLIASSWADLRSQVKGIREKLEGFGERLKTVEGRSIENAVAIAALRPDDE